MYLTDYGDMKIYNTSLAVVINLPLSRSISIISQISQPISLLNTAHTYIIGVH